MEVETEKGRSNITLVHIEKMTTIMKFWIMQILVRLKRILDSG